MKCNIRNYDDHNLMGGYTYCSKLESTAALVGPALTRALKVLLMQFLDLGKYR